MREDVVFKEFAEVVFIDAGEDAAVKFERAGMLAVFQAERALELHPAGEAVATEQFLEQGQQAVAARLVARRTQAQINCGGRTHRGEDKKN